MTSPPVVSMPSPPFPIESLLTPRGGRRFQGPVTDRGRRKKRREFFTTFRRESAMAHGCGWQVAVGRTKLRAGGPFATCNEIIEGFLHSPCTFVRVCAGRRRRRLHAPGSTVRARHLMDFLASSLSLSLSRARCERSLRSLCAGPRTYLAMERPTIVPPRAHPRGWLVRMSFCVRAASA